MGCTVAPSGINYDDPNLKNISKMINIDHPLNINLRYQHLYDMNPIDFVGEGIFKTHAYFCKTTEQQLILKQKQFWETRTSGQLFRWQAIKEALQLRDSNEAQKILHQVGLYELNNSIQLCVDKKFKRYEVPVFVINNASSYAKKTLAENNIKSKFVVENIQIKIRSVKFSEDTKFSISNNFSVKDLKDLFKSQREISPDAKIRFFAYGKELLDQYEIGNYKLTNGDTIQTLIQ